MYIKTFRFRVSNATTQCFTEDKDKSWFSEGQKELVSEEDITKRINKYINTSIPDRKVIDIKITPIDVKYHNNGRSNTIDLIYTIMYE